MFDVASTPEDIEARYGTRSFWLPPPSLINKARYLSGAPALDAYLIGNPSFSAPPVIFWDHQQGLVVELLGSGGTKIDVPDALVEAVALEDREEVRKDKSVAGRALAGGLIFGPVGALVGGMSGIGTKAAKGDTPDVLLTIWCSDGANQATLVFSVRFKHRREVENFFRRKYPLAFGAQPPAPPSPASPDDVIGQLERLADLHARGVLSDAEFEAQKARLLAR